MYLPGFKFFVAFFVFNESNLQLHLLTYPLTQHNYIPAMMNI